MEGGPWFIGGNIIGLDKWSPSFIPESLKGLSAPVLIRMPCLPLHCWDEHNICRIASMIRVPIYLDGNSFKWGKREYARVCIRIDLDKKLPKGVYIEGKHGRSFQKVEYEKISSLCYHCGKIGHLKNTCPLTNPANTFSPITNVSNEGMFHEKIEIRNQKSEIWKPVNQKNPPIYIASTIEEGEIIEPQNNVAIQNSRPDAKGNSIVNSDFCLKNNFSVLEEILDDTSMGDTLENDVIAEQVQTGKLPPNIVDCTSPDNSIKKNLVITNNANTGEYAFKIASGKF
ncbi:uncharacterized protein LOC110102323 [Dendrobium catenatum]|uniref:uncharacterized protein LOC110102323 n=1 Tax=Dendrobium catenatum TaxID=906689 RepID=UPI0009F4CCCA|nr:uncharacterized protein LOC110102323 [Dendrobium catenatum]